MTAVGMMCIHERERLTAAVLNHYRSIGLPIVAAVSPEDFGLHSKLLEREIAHKNQPIGKKHNAALALCRTLNPDVVINIPSDDLLCKDYVDRAVNVALENDWVYSRSIYFYGAQERLLIYFSLYPGLGAGRAFNKRLLDRCDWHLWDDQKTWGLDGNSTDVIKKATNFNYDAVDMGDVRSEGMAVVDVKTAENLHGFEKITQRRDWSMIPIEESLEMLTEKFPSVFVPRPTASLGFETESQPRSEFARTVVTG